MNDSNHRTTDVREEVPAGLMICQNISCDYRTTESLSSCPKCQRPLLTEQSFRSLGWVLVGIGGFLAVIGLSLAGWILPMVGTGLEARLLVLGTFGVLIAFGLTFTAAGFQQALTAKRSRSLMTVLFLLLTALGFVIAAVRVLL